MERVKQDECRKFMGSVWIYPDNELNREEFKRIKKSIIEGGGKAEIIVGESVE